jgi:hypothetical protein
VPEKQRSDLAEELRGSIADQIDARVEMGEGPDAAERAVLTELGDPDKLAAGYTGRVLHLIGPKYYLDWWRLLKLLLWIVPVCVAFFSALGQMISGAAIGSVIWPALVGAGMAVIQVSFWVTVVFALLERTGNETMDAGPWTPDRLPEPKLTGAKFSDLVTSLAWLAILAGALVWDRMLGLAYVDGHWTPVLDPALWPWWMTGFFAIIAVEAVVSVAVYRRGRWTPGLATVHGVLDLIGMAAALWLLFEGRLVNPAVVSAVSDAAGADVSRILAILIAFGIVAIAVWDALNAFLKARRSPAA